MNLINEPLETCSILAKCSIRRDFNTGRIMARFSNIKQCLLRALESRSQ